MVVVGHTRHTAVRGRQRCVQSAGPPSHHVYKKITRNRGTQLPTFDVAMDDFIFEGGSDWHELDFDFDFGGEGTGGGAGSSGAVSLPAGHSSFVCEV